MFRELYICHNWPSSAQFTNGMQQQFEGLVIGSSPLNSFKMARAIFRMCHFEVFVEPFLRNGGFHLQTDWSDRSVLRNNKRP